MDLKLTKGSVLTLAKRTQSAYIMFLKVYKTVLAVKIYGIDTIIKLLSPHQTHTKEDSILQSTNIKKENTKMKKTNFFAIFTFIAAVGAAIAGCVYFLRKKEKELEEYESMLFSEEYLEDYMPEDEECDCTDDDCCCGEKKGCDVAQENNACSCPVDEKSPEEPQF